MTTKKTLEKTDSVAKSELCPFLTLAQEKAYREHEMGAFTPKDQDFFMAICGTTGLNPLKRQIWATVRREQDPRTEQWINKLVAVTSIDGYRSIAAATGKYQGQTEPRWCNKDGEWKDVWLSDGMAPYACKIGVRREGFTEALVAVGRYDSYVQLRKVQGGKSEPTQFWKKSPDGQLAKCVEALALRKAFPQELAGIYIEDEMHTSEENGSEPSSPEPETEPEKPKTVPEVEPPKRQRKKAEEKPPQAPEKAPEKPAEPEPEKPKAETPPVAGDPLFDDVPAQGKKKDPVLEYQLAFVTSEGYRDKKLGELTLDQLNKIKTHWIDKVPERIAAHEGKKTEAAMVLKAIELLTQVSK